MEDIRNGTSSSFPCRLITVAFEYFACLWVTNIILLGVQNSFLFFFPKVKQLVMNTTQESAPRQCVGRWQGVWEDTGRYLSRLSPPMVLNFTPGQG